MKQLLLLTTLLIANLNAQSQSFNLRIGTGLAKQLDKDNNEKYSDQYNTKIGLMGGVTYEAPLGESAALELGIGIESKGFQVKSESLNIRVLSSPIYLTAPIMLKFSQPLNNGIKIYENIGIYTSYGIGGKSKVGNYDFDSKQSYPLNWGGNDTQDDYKSLDYGITFGGGVENNKIQYGFLYNFGLANISPSTVDGNVIKNRMFKIYFGIKLGNQKDSPASSE